MPSRYFTVEEADAQLPWLELVLTRLAQLHRELEQGREKLLALVRESRRNGGSRGRAIAESQSKVEERRREAERVLEEVGARGIVLREPARGLVDFPSIREGREVYLCWLLGESEVQFWHEVDAGFPGRQPL